VCICNDQQGYSWQLELPGGDATTETCASVMPLCADASLLETDGPIECEQRYQEGQGSYCSADLSCKQDGTIGDQAVRAFGQLYLSCQLNGDAWTCSCNSGTNSGSVTVEADDAWNACEAGAEACQEAIEVQIGGGGGVIGRPMPIPF
jgi:hypothetical protein